MYTYVQRPVCKKENTATYVYIRAASRTPTRAYVRRGLVYMAGSERNAWLCSSRGLGRNRRWKRGLAYRTTEETALCSSGHVRNRVLLIGRGLAYRKTEETTLCSTSHVRKRDPIHRDGPGVPQNRGNGPPTVKTGVLFIRRGVAYRKTGLHGILFISTVNPLQPPRATVHPPSTSSSLHLRLFIHGLLFI